MNSKGYMPVWQRRDEQPETLEGNDPGTSTWRHEEGVMKPPGRLSIPVMRSSASANL
jgi:hypothetical protein